MNNQDFFSPKEQNIQNLLVLTSFRLESMFDKLVFKPLEISSACFRILFILDRLAPVSPMEIVELLGIGKSNLTQRLNFLNRTGLVEKGLGDQKDRRKITLNLTTLGRKKVKETLVILEEMNGQIEKHFTKEEKQEFFRLMKKITSVVENGLINPRHCLNLDKKKN